MRGWRDADQAEATAVSEATTTTRRATTPATGTLRKFSIAVALAALDGVKGRGIRAPTERQLGRRATTWWRLCGAPSYGLGVLRSFARNKKPRRSGAVQK